MTRFPPTRLAALERLSRFVPIAGRTYAARRNYDLGRGNHDGVSNLSPYLRARLLTESEVLDAVLRRHSPGAAEKFVQEVFWRTYWKGWLEMRPDVWMQYKTSIKGHLDAVQTQSGLRAQWEAACMGQTDIDCFNEWARELVETGYLHNHARMWFASIWIFTLRLPWELGADFFLRHLLDGDPASNTLGWRWVAGIQTPGKTYLARTSNISKFTEGRFAPKWQLSSEAPALSACPTPERKPLPMDGKIRPGLRSGLLLHDDDLSPGYLLGGRFAPITTAVVSTRQSLSPLSVAPHVTSFAEGAVVDVKTRYAERLGATARPEPTVAGIRHWAEAESLEQIITPYAPVGPNADLIARLSNSDQGPVVTQVRRDYDSAAWPHATHGFFRFKDNIPKLLRNMKGLNSVC